MTATGAPKETFHVFLSSPGDMDEERRIVRQVFDSLNRSIATPFGITLEVIDWENYTTIGYKKTQDLITEQTLNKYADSLVLVIGLMGQRFGTPTGKFGSGTQAEFKWAVERNERHGHPEIKWFFRRVELFTAPAGIPAIREAVAQWQKVQTFRRGYKGLYKEFATTAMFADVFRDDLFRWFAAWISKKRNLDPRNGATDALQALTVPDFLDNRLSRTLHIASALQDMLAGLPAEHEPCIRICAVMSSLAITKDSAWAGPGNDEYLQLIENERDQIEALFEKKASLKILLTWNMHDIAGWPEKSRADAVTRLKRLRSFCEKTLGDARRTQRAELVHARLRERNLLILGNKYVFEGRKLSTDEGFEATQVIKNNRRIGQEIEMFDILFNNARRTAQKALGIEKRNGVNRQLLLALIKRIDGDVAELEASLGRRRRREKAS